MGSGQHSPYPVIIDETTGARTKWCPGCERYRSVDRNEWGTRDHGYLSFQCRDCMNRSHRERRRAGGDDYRRQEAERQRRRRARERSAA